MPKATLAKLRIFVDAIDSHSRGAVLKCQLITEDDVVLGEWTPETVEVSSYMEVGPCLAVEKMMGQDRITAELIIDVPKSTPAKALPVEEEAPKQDQPAKNKPHHK